MTILSASRRRHVATVALPWLVTTRAFALMVNSPVPYDPPAWTSGKLQTPPAHGRLLLANLPTPLYAIQFPSNSHIQQTLTGTNCKLYIKRDDCSSGVELGGNKVRKLEFLLADALHQGCDSVVTIGGEQSNHCRATAAAARMVGLEPHLILRTKKPDDTDLGLTGNLLLDRMVGSSIYTCSPGEYGRVGSNTLVDGVCQQLKAKGKCPYAIPVGGSNGLGSWGYVNGVAELVEQWRNLEAEPTLDHIVFACGSGGTAAGIALGVAFALSDSGSPRPKVHAIGVCDDEDYFYRFIANIADQMGFVCPSNVDSTESFVRLHLQVHQGKGLGYAVSTPEELEFVATFAKESGIVLDPVYSGKALFNFFELVRSNPADYKGNMLFWHTGGALGLFDKCDDLRELLSRNSPCQRLDVYGKGVGMNISSQAS